MTNKHKRTVDLIRERILAEHSKHYHHSDDGEWAQIAAQKIVLSLEENGTLL
jgi:hypothetical protein